MKTIFLCCGILLMGALQVYGQNNAEKDIRRAMSLQQEAWNKGDVAAFMETYWKSDSLLFVGSSGPVYGWQGAFDRYLKTYPDQASMGTLKFDLLQINPLSESYYFVLGKWHLTRKKGNIGGTFTLLFKKIAAKWVIISDHTSQS
ncbi:MAG TPA: nuclear transport factor 2 family protein [Pseudosphingobacterium sp.]|nr:nuclear transport factor 2 family protein [Pseudosphingobacterium sp.]